MLKVDLLKGRVSTTRNRKYISPEDFIYETASLSLPSSGCGVFFSIACDTYSFVFNFLLQFVWKDRNCNKKIIRFLMNFEPFRQKVTRQSISPVEIITLAIVKVSTSFFVRPIGKKVQLASAGTADTFQMCLDRTSID